MHAIHCITIYERMYTYIHTNKQINLYTTFFIIYTKMEKKVEIEKFEAYYLALLLKVFMHACYMRLHRMSHSHHVCI